MAPEAKEKGKKKRTSKQRQKPLTKKLLQKQAKEGKKKKALKHRQKPLTKEILVHRELKTPKKIKKSSRGVVYFSHVPHGFYENELRQFLSQFGIVTNIRIPRSIRTGRYKGYAFVEFLYPDVAKIVAETMNNYLMFSKIVKAKYLPPEEQKPYVFGFPKVRVPLSIRRKRFLRKRSNRVLDKNECKQEKKRLSINVGKKLNKLERLGVDYKFQIDGQVQEPPPKAPKVVKA